MGTLPLPYAGNSLVHDACVLAGVAVAAWVFDRERRRAGVTDDRVWFVVAMCLVLGAIFSRLGTWAQHLDPGQNAGLVEHWLYGNRSILGGLLGAWLGVHLGKRLIGYRPKTGNLFAPAVAAGMAVGRIGCLLTETPGTPTGTGWGLTLSPTDAAALGAPAGVGLHPSFAYEIVFHLVALALLLRWRDRVVDPGGLFVLYVTGYAAFRFLVEFVRGNEIAWSGLTRPQLFLLLTLPVLVWRSRVVLSRREVAHEPATL